MKVACTGGAPRNISQTYLEQAMMRAWRNNFYAIFQVSNTVFFAHFRTQEDMVSVYTRQPWAMGTDNLLLDWFDPSFDPDSSDDYKFEHIFVTIRAYGIPRNRRSLGLLADILNQVGTVSEFHIMQENNLFARHDYIWGTVKLKVINPVKDRVIVGYSDNTTGLVYLHYEKIGRICLFCGVMFHNAENCSIRNNLIAERSKSKQEQLHIPTQRFGQWIIDESYVPTKVIQSTRIAHQGSNQSGSAILSRL
uniref:Uncharacterized protein n=1 Tax=Avena sativa TaxID=4498 RepID=A0ACD5UVR7_AVESA